MRKRSIYTIPAAATLVIALGLTTGALLPDKGVEPPTPAAATFTLPPVLAAAATCQEDEPCWNCETMGNLICSGTELDGLELRQAWDLWDAAGGAERLLVNPHAMVTLTGYSLTDPYAPGAPELGIQDVALHGTGKWFVFTAKAL